MKHIIPAIVIAILVIILGLFIYSAQTSQIEGIQSSGTVEINQETPRDVPLDVVVESEETQEETPTIVVIPEEIEINETEEENESSEVLVTTPVEESVSENAAQSITYTSIVGHATVASDVYIVNRVEFYTDENVNPEEMIFYFENTYLEKEYTYNETLNCSNVPKVISARNKYFGMQETESGLLFCMALPADLRRSQSIYTETRASGYMVYNQTLAIPAIFSQLTYNFI